MNMKKPTITKAGKESSRQNGSQKQTQMMKLTELSPNTLESAFLAYQMS